MVPVETSEGVRHCLVFQTVERLRADDFRQGNIILDVTVSSATEMDVADVAYAYGFEPSDSSFLTRTMERLAQENKLLVKVNPSFGCAAVVVCAGLEVTGDVLPR